MNSTKAVAVSIQAVSPEFKTGASSAKTSEGKIRANVNKRAIITQGFFSIGPRSEILFFMKLNS
ncbi:MAG: hypothetical protein VB778_05065 [Nitrospinaceae bacterium]